MSIEERKIIVKDEFQNYINNNFPGIKKYSLLNDMIFYGIFIYYYYFGPIEDSVKNFLIVKYIILVLVLRYIFNSLTNLTENKDETIVNYYQLNSKLAIFIILIFFLSDSSLSNTTLAIIGVYTLLISAINVDKSNTTVDNIFTTVLMLYIFSLTIV